MIGVLYLNVFLTYFFFTWLLHARKCTFQCRCLRALITESRRVKALTSRSWKEVDEGSAADRI